MSVGRSTRWRLALAAMVAAVAAGVVALLTDGGDANTGATKTAAHWSALQPSPLARSEVGSARIGRFVYVVGGFAAPDGNTTGKLARYDIDSGTWTLVAPMPVGVNHPAVAASAGRLYVYGGYRASGELAGETDALRRYDPATDTWTTLTGSGIPRAAATLAAHRGRLYAIGGARAGSTALNLVQIYDIARDAWRRGPDLRVAREHLASVALGRMIFVVGGRASGRNLGAFERLDVRGRKWQRLPGLRTPRSGFGAVVVKGEIIVVGGEQLAEGDQTIRSVELYDPALRRWRRLPSMLTPRHGLGVSSWGRTVFAVEGGPRPGFSFSTALEALRVPRLPSAR
jgi:N-acetylneuraminic acid mutarotase